MNGMRASRQRSTVARSNQPDDRIERRPAPGPHVVLTHPGRQHGYETVVAAQTAGMLQRFVTSFYWRGDTSVSAGLWRALPDRWTDRLRTNLKRRWHPEIDPSLVSIVPAFHACALLAARTQQMLPSLGSPHAYRWADLAFDRFVSRWLRSQPRPAIVHGFEGGAVSTLRAAQRLGCATVLDVASAHEYFVQAIRDEGDLIDETWQAWETASIQAERRAADWLFVASDYVRRCLHDDGVPDGRIVQIPYGADPERFRPHEDKRRWRRDSEPLRVLYVGRIDARKGIRYLLEAWRGLRLPHAELVLAGGADRFGAELLTQCPSTVRWLGNVPYPSVHTLFQTSDLFVCPSLAETGPLVVYEAMAAGLPVVTTENAQAVVRDGVDGFVVPVRSPAAIAERIEWLSRFPRERAAMGASARQRILDRYTWRHYHARVACAYRAMSRGGSVQAALDELEDGWPVHRRRASAPAVVV